MKRIRSLVSLMILLNILCYNIDSIQGIQGGDDVPSGEFGYQVSVLINGQHACGGVILDYKRVLSAAQCVLNKKGNFLDVKLEIIYGVSYLDNWALENKVAIIYVYILDEFRPPNRGDHLFPDTFEAGDLAVLEIEGTLSLINNPYVKSVLLPVSRHGLYQKYSFKTANISGYGQDAPMNYQSSSDLSNLHLRRNYNGKLTYLKTNVQRRDICMYLYPEYQESHLCVKSDVYNHPSGTCLGDVGSPLVLNNYIIGILQIYTKDCDDTFAPALYTRVTSFIPFIEAAMRGEFQFNMRLANYTGLHVNEIIHPSKLT